MQYWPFNSVGHSHQTKHYCAKECLQNILWAKNAKQIFWWIKQMWLYGCKECGDSRICGHKSKGHYEGIAVLSPSEYGILIHDERTDLHHRFMSIWADSQDAWNCRRCLRPCSLEINVVSQVSCCLQHKHVHKNTFWNAPSGFWSQDLWLIGPTLFHLANRAHCMLEQNLYILVQRYG